MESDIKQGHSAARAFSRYLEENKVIAIAAVIITLFIYGTRIFSYNVGVDTDLYLADSYHINKEVDPGVGRFGLALLQQLWEGKGLKMNIFAANFAACAFLAASGLLWCHVFGKYKKKSVGSCIVFLLFYVSSPIWAENIYFTLLAAENMFGVMLCPICAYLMWEGIKARKRAWAALSVGLLSLIISIYQPAATLFFAGVMAVFILDAEQGILTKQEKNRKFLTVIALTAVSFALYAVLHIIFACFVYRTGMSDYLIGQIGGHRPLKQAVFLSCAAIYKFFFGNTDIFNGIVDPLVAGTAKSGEMAVKVFHETGLHGCILYAPALAILAVIILKKQKGQGAAYYAAWAGLFISTAAFIIAGGGIAAVRTLFAFAFAGAFFMYYTLLGIQNMRIQTVWLVLCLCFGYFQVRNSSLLICSDEVRYQQDVWLSEEINRGIMRVQEEGQEKLPVLVIGEYDFYRGDNFLKYEVVGESSLFYGASGAKNESTHRTLAFMKAHGFCYREVRTDDVRLGAYRHRAQSMPVFPQEGWAEAYDGCVIVKMSEPVYEEN